MEHLTCEASPLSTGPAAAAAAATNEGGGVHATGAGTLITMGSNEYCCQGKELWVTNVQTACSQEAGVQEKWVRVFAGTHHCVALSGEV